MKKYIGDKAFYKMVLLIAIPIMVQQGITNFVSLLDNVMVGRLGTEQMSGVAIVNQLVFVYNLSLFGAMSGAGIFGAQFFGKGDHDGVRNCFRFKIIAGICLVIGASLLLWFGRETLINLYLQESGESVGNLASTYQYAEKYLGLILIGLLPTAFSQCYSSALRENGETMTAMIAGMIAVGVNLLGNYLLIFGPGPFPALGVQGAAIATVASRYVEMLILMITTQRRADRFPFIRGAYRSFRVPMWLTLKIFKTGMPLFVNEFLWASGMSFLLQCYAMRGLVALAAYNISSTVNNLFIICFIALGDSISIICGQLLGAGKVEEAKATDKKLIFFDVTLNVGIAMILFMVAPLIPRIYNTTESVRVLATQFLRVAAVCMPMQAFSHASYFTLRCGGKTWITFFCDSVYVWCVNVTIAYMLSRYTSLPVILIYAIIQGSEIIKVIIGAIMIRSGIWAHSLVHEKDKEVGIESN